MRNWNQKSLWLLGCFGLVTMVGCHKALEDKNATNTYRSNGKKKPSSRNRGKNKKAYCK